MKLKRLIKTFKEKIMWTSVFSLSAIILICLTTIGIVSGNNKRLYMQGLEFVNKKDYQNAYYNFSAVSSGNPTGISMPFGNEYYCPAKYRAALAAENLYDKTSASHMYKDVVKSCATTMFEFPAKYNLAKIEYEQKKFKKAKRIFKDLNKNEKNEELKIASNYYLGEIEKEKDKTVAAKYFITYLNNSPDGKLAQSSRDALIAMKYPIPQRLKAEKGEDYKLFEKAEKLSGNDALKIYLEIYNRFPNGDYAAYSLWKLVWANYKAQRYDQVLHLGLIHEKKYPNSKTAPRVQFYMAKTLGKLGVSRTQESRGMYNRIIRKYPDDYYALRAKAMLNHKKSAWAIGEKRHINTMNSNIPFPLLQSKLTIKDINLIKLLIGAGDTKLLKELLKNNPPAQSWIAYREGNRATSIITAREYLEKLETKPSFSDSLYKLAYPLYYTKQINQVALHNRLDPYVILSVMKEESHFETGSKSYVGANGLMQIMPDTASFIAQKYSIPYSINTISQPETNIALGTYYFKYVLDEMQGKYVLAVAGYNGGHNAVKNWQNAISYEDYDEFVEEIPYEETQNYIRKVFKSYWNYLNIYDNIE